MRRAFAFLFAVGALAFGACGLDIVGVGVGVDATPPTPVDAAMDANAPIVDASTASDAATEAGPPPCGPARAGPTMIDVGGYCIDATEVTQAQYAAFAADVDGGYDAGARAVCSWKTSYDVPELGAGVPCSYAPSSTPNVAVVCVDWCDADAYCRWAGKRLCGAVDGGGAVAWSGDETIDAGRDEWYRACKKVSADASACSTGDRGVGRAADAGAFFACGSGGIFDLNGNVDEHEDGCEGTTGAADRCRYRGGSWFWSTTESSCEHRYGETEVTRAARFADVGFRCCSR